MHGVAGGKPIQVWESRSQIWSRHNRRRALPFEHPKLSVTANVGPNIGFAIRDELANGLVIDGEAERIGEVDR
jgi:hypothetical protein